MAILMHSTTKRLQQVRIGDIIFFSSNCIDGLHSEKLNSIGADADTLVLTYNRNYYGGALHGILQSNKTFYSIEFVDMGLHAFKTLKEVSPELTKHLSSGSITIGRSQENNSLPQSKNTSIVTVYIKFYYTQMFYDSTDDVNGFIDKLISQVNQLLKVDIIDI